MPTTEEQIKKIISQSDGKATKRQIVRESKLSSGYIDYLCQSLCRKGEIIFRPLNKEYFQKMSGVLKRSGLVKALEETRSEDLKREEEKIGRRKGSR